MDTPPPHDLPPEPPILLPAADLPPLEPAEPVTVLEPVPPVRGLSLTQKLMVSAAAYIVMAAVLWVIGGEARLFIICSLVVPPIVTLPLLAYVGERELAARVIAVTYWFIVVGMVGLGTFGSAAGTALGPEAFAAIQEHRPWSQIAQLVPPGGLTKVTLAALGIAVGVFIGIACYTPGLRRVAARKLPLDPRSFVHAAALASLMALMIVTIVPLLVLGSPPALSPNSTKETAEQLQQLTEDQLLRLTCYLYFWLIGSLVCFVGFPLVRSFGAALGRLGLVVPSVRQVAIAVLSAIALLVVMVGFHWAVAELWQYLGWPRTDEKAFEGLMKFALNPAGAVVIGVTAGLSEELAVRGVLQPRLGILLPNLFFTAGHGLQYNWDGLLSVFLLGLVFGLLRKRFNTSTSVIAHGTYDFLAVMLTFLTTPTG